MNDDNSININVIIQRYFIEPLDDENPILLIINTLKSYFIENNKIINSNLENFENKQIIIDYEYIRDTLPVEDFVSVLHQSPLMVLKCLAVGIHAASIELGHQISVQKLRVRLANYAPMLPLKFLKSNLIDKFVALTGNIVRVTNVRPIITSMYFECSKCGYKFLKKFVDGIYKRPSACESENGKCNSTYFVPDRSSATAVDFQIVKIQEILDNSEQDQGRIPRTVECELTRDLVDCCAPGDIVKISGIVKARKLQQRGTNRSLYILYVDANFVQNSNNSDKNTKLDQYAFDDNDFQAITAIANEPNLFKYLVNSLCASIYGHEVVKAGMLLCLFGGSNKNSVDRDDVNVRENIHLLIVGDPGLGKSQLLRAVSQVASRGVYVCGNTSSTTGLTVTMIRDAASEFALEAGALVLADEGVCCIDEFDKMNSEHNSLLEAMEQQSVSIAKAGIVCTLSARTSVIAAANPVGGHYDKNRTVAENLKLSSPLLSRFDMIFILMDNPNEDHDQRISEHVIGLHSTKKSSNNFSSQYRTTLTNTQSQMSQYDEWKNNNGLSERLRLKKSERKSFDPIPIILLTRYISYARKFVKPRLSYAARKALRDFYLQLRKDHQSQDGTPITTRQLESLIRMAEARAKCELREIVTKDDAIDVIDIMKDSLHDFFSDELGVLDFKRASGMSKSKQISVYVKALHKLSESKKSSIFTRDELFNIGDQLNLGIDNFGEFIDLINDHNYILKRGPRKYQLQSSKYSQQC